jgi:hypothetical protein
VEWRVLRGLMALAADESASDTVRASATAALIGLADRLQQGLRKADPLAPAARQEIIRFLDRPLPESTEAPDPAPPGSPIG